MHSNVTIKNVSWPHFSWPTLYITVVIVCSHCEELLCGIYCLHMVDIDYAMHG